MGAMLFSGRYFSGRFGKSAFNRPAASTDSVGKGGIANTRFICPFFKRLSFAIIGNGARALLSLFCQRFFNRPTAMQASTNSSFINTKIFCPLRYAFRLICKSQHFTALKSGFFGKSAFNIPIVIKETLSQSSVFNAILSCPFFKSLGFSIQGNFAKFHSPSWLRKHSFYGPIPAHSMKQGVVAYTSRVGPLREGFGFPVKGNVSIFASIVCLLFLREPSAIFWGVRAIVINSIKAVLRGGAFSHIGNKILKGILPSVANVNTSAAIMGIAFIVGIVAPLPHASPYMIFGSIPALVCCRDKKATIGTKPDPCLSFSVQFCCKNNTLAATVTPAQPPISPSVGVTKTDYGPVTNFFSRQVCVLHNALSLFELVNNMYYNTIGAR